MRRVITGQTLLIVCCVFYLAWWYRAYRPGVSVSQTGGINGVLLLITMVLGISGTVFSLTLIPEVSGPEHYPLMITGAGIAAYMVLLLVTKYVFHRVVTAELFLIVAWTVLEALVIHSLYAGKFLSGSGVMFLGSVITAAFVISMVLYMAYYRMEEMKAFYAAMVPLVTEAVAMAVLISVVDKSGR